MAVRVKPARANLDRRKVPGEVEWGWPGDVPTDPDKANQAIETFRRRLPMKPEKFKQLTAEEKLRAFTVSEVASADVIDDVWQSLDRAIAKGQTLEEWKGGIADELTAAWGKDKPYRLENIFRTNLQTAYAQGRDEELRDPDIVAVRPFWMFTAVLDTRTTDICRECNGTVLPWDNPWWLGHTPPLHYQCRSTKIALRKEQARQFGITRKAPRMEPLDGFGAVDKKWKPDLSGYPKPIADELRKRLKRE